MLSRTLGPSEGCTILTPLEQPCCPVNGYVVGIKGIITEFTIAENTQAWDVCIEGLLEMYRVLKCEHRPKFGIGTWLCDHGKPYHIHFDVVFWTPSARTAALVGLATGQRAIYDVEKGELIHVRTDDDENAQTVDA